MKSLTWSCAMFASEEAHVDPNNVPLASLVEQENHQVDVNLVARNNFNNNAYRNNFGGNNNYRPYPSNNGNYHGNSYENSNENA